MANPQKNLAHLVKCHPQRQNSCHDGEVDDKIKWQTRNLTTLLCKAFRSSEPSQLGYSGCNYLYARLWCCSILCWCQQSHTSSGTHMHRLIKVLYVERHKETVAEAGNTGKAIMPGAEGGCLAVLIHLAAMADAGWHGKANGLGVEPSAEVSSRKFASLHAP